VKIYEGSLGENPQGFPAQNAGMNLGGKGELCRAGGPCKDDAGLARSNTIRL
jgi:hypothetical protein